ncbi:TonB-dependent receptor, partial [bacterium]|nr:TonB-dependent receptor [bacterium]
MKFTRIILGLILFAAFGCTVPVFAESNPADDDTSALVYTLEEVVVYGIRAFGNTSMITEITAEEIQERNAVTVADILRSDPGLAVTTGVKAETETKIRGFPARDVLVLVDGRPINPGYYGKVDLAMLPLDNIAKIKIIKGPASVAYGANSMGGVINIVTKNGLETPQTVVESEFGDYKFRKLSVNHSRQVGRFNYWLSGYENYSDGYVLSKDFAATSLEDGGLRGNSFYHKSGVSGKLGFQPSPANLYALSLGYHWAKKDVPYTIYTFESPQFRTFPEWQRISSALSGNWLLRDDMSLKAIVFADAQHDRLIDYSGSAMRDDQIVWDSKLENWTFGSSVDGRFDVGKNHRLQAGMNFKRDLMNKKPDVNDPWVSHTIYTGTVFSQDNYRPWKRTEITAGVSYNVFGIEEKNLTTQKLCPMVSVRQGLPWELQGRASYANAIRFPTLHHLYSESSGNPDLNAEQADKFEVGLERSFEFNSPHRFLSIEIAFFRNDLTDLIYRAARSYRFQNIGDATLQGWELRTQFELSRYISGDVSYGYIDPNESSTVLLEEVSPNRIRASLTGRTGFGTKMLYELNAFDERSTYIATRDLSAY